MIKLVKLQHSLFILLLTIWLSTKKL